MRSEGWLCVYIKLRQLLVGFNSIFFLLAVYGPPGEQVSGVSASEARLDVEHGHVPPAGGVVVGGWAGVCGAGFVLDELEEDLHVGAQPGHDPGPHRRHRLLVAGLQRLEQGAVVPAGQTETCSSQTLAFCLTGSYLHQNFTVQNLNIYNKCCKSLISYIKKSF